MRKVSGPMTKICQTCKNEFPRPMYKNSKGVLVYASVSNFEKQKFCSVECYRKNPKCGESSRGRAFSYRSSRTLEKDSEWHEQGCTTRKMTPEELRRYL